MDAYTSPSRPRQRASWIACLARRVQHGAVEWHHASKLASELLLTRGLIEPDRAPDTYAEFRLRTPATTLHEPPARCRAKGSRVK
jgi:hypothetical protein